MAKILIDTNLLLRLVDPASAKQRVADLAIRNLHLRGHTLHITAQNIIEFWAVATRPVEANGLGWDSQRATREIAALRSSFPLLPDTAQILEELQPILEKCRVVGKRTHDARLVAVMKTHSVDHLLTFNGVDFKSFPGVSILTPENV